MADQEELKKKLDDLLEDFKQYMEDKGIESVTLKFPDGDRDPRPEKIEGASTIQILDYKPKPGQKG
ncbi:MAG TPA: hypothetical protein ENI20_12130 [Bacteroides sp.]|nr:hypothetical protein [Bacteroides sp.]